MPPCPPPQYANVYSKLTDRQTEVVHKNAGEFIILLYNYCIDGSVNQYVIVKQFFSTKYRKCIAIISTRLKSRGYLECVMIKLIA